MFFGGVYGRFAKFRTEQGHLRHVETVLQRILNHELYVSPSKCEFMKEAIVFLGLVVDMDEIRVNPKKIEVIQQWTCPESVTEDRSFLGLAQFSDDSYLTPPELHPP